MVQVWKVEVNWRILHSKIVSIFRRHSNNYLYPLSLTSIYFHQKFEWFHSVPNNISKISCWSNQCYMLYIKKHIFSASVSFSAFLTQIILIHCMWMIFQLIAVKMLRKDSEAYIKKRTSLVITLLVIHLFFSLVWQKWNNQRWKNNAKNKSQWIEWLLNYNFNLRFNFIEFSQVIIITRWSTRSIFDTIVIFGIEEKITLRCLSISRLKVSLSKLVLYWKN